VLLVIAGWVLRSGSAALLLYGAGVALAFHLFVVLYEEPVLRRSFGGEYEAYCSRVGRWLPRLGRREP
jgi:protein-S-isoprenylcysteine O-methyltransferase Ste14